MGYINKNGRLAQNVTVRFSGEDIRMGKALTEEYGESISMILRRSLFKFYEANLDRLEKSNKSKK